MSSGADLFVVCKQCGSEVSPYITECPYCGNRLRRRAPKLPRVGEAAGVGSSRRQGIGSLLGRGRAGSGARPAPRPVRERSDRWVATRPHATIALVAVSCVSLIVMRVEPAWLGHLVVGPELAIRNGSIVLIGGLHGEWWKLLSAQFAYSQGGGGGVYAFVAIVATGLFGWLAERRHGPAVVLALFLGAGAVGVLAADAVYALPFLAGANAGALALVAAWAAPDLRARRAGEHYEGDLLGAGAFAALLLAAPFAVPEASWLAGVIGALLGLLFGLALERPGRADR